MRNRLSVCSLFLWCGAAPTCGFVCACMHVCVLWPYVRVSKNVKTKESMSYLTKVRQCVTSYNIIHFFGTWYTQVQSQMYVLLHTTKMQLWIRTNKLFLSCSSCSIQCSAPTIEFWLKNEKFYLFSDHFLGQILIFFLL